MKPASTGPASAEACKLYRVGSLAREAGKTVRAIRFYEELGLLDPVSRTKGGFRQYDSNALVRIHWIDRLQELGFSLKEIGDFLGTIRGQDTAPAAMEQLASSYTEKLAETRAAIARLRALERELLDAVDYLSACRSCAPSTELSACPSCGVSEHRDVEPPTMVAAVQDAV